MSSVKYVVMKNAFLMSFGFGLLLTVNVSAVFAVADDAVSPNCISEKVTQFFKQEQGFTSDTKEIEFNYNGEENVSEQIGSNLDGQIKNTLVSGSTTEIRRLDAGLNGGVLHLYFAKNKPCNPTKVLVTCTALTPPLFFAKIKLSAANECIPPKQPKKKKEAKPAQGETQTTDIASPAEEIPPYRCEMEALFCRALTAKWVATPAKEEN